MFVISRALEALQWRSWRSLVMDVGCPVDDCCLVHSRISIDKPEWILSSVDTVVNIFQPNVNLTITWAFGCKGSQTSSCPPKNNFCNNEHVFFCGFTWPCYFMLLGLWRTAPETINLWSSVMYTSSSIIEHISINIQRRYSSSIWAMLLKTLI